MFRWRRRNEGFEWREYVRTTVRLRRERRREIIDNARLAAVEGAKEAGRRSAGAATGAARSLGQTLVIFFFSFLDTLKQVAVWSGTMLARLGIGAYGLLRIALARAADVLGPILRRATSRAEWLIAPAIDFIRRPDMTLMLTLIALVSAFSAGHGFWSRGLDGEAAVAAAVAALALALVIGSRGARARRWSPHAAAPVLLERAGEALVLLPGLDRLTPRAAGLVTLAVLAVAGAGGTWLAYGGGISLAQVAAPVLETFAAERIEGRAAALTGDRLRVADATIELDGVEAPDPDQLCRRPSGQWRCGQSAKEALARAVRRRQVVCEITGMRDSETKIGRCTARGSDIAAALVRGGHVFAASGLFARYKDHENQARSARTGLWSGDAERPSEFRAKRWEEAKKESPDGCPIKGRVSSGSRVYVLPWSPTYDRVHVATARGERWFCSEEEAQAAGWRRAAQSY